MAKKYISVFGSGKDTAGKMYRKMEEVGRLLAEHDCAVVTGGFGGSGMEAPAKGAKLAGGETWGFTMLARVANFFIDKVYDVSKMCPRKDGKEWLLEEQYGLRLGNLLTSDGFIIADNDQTIGTLVELCAVINLNEKFWEKKKLVAIMVSDQGHLKVMEQIIKTFIPNNNYLMVFYDPAKAVGWVTV